MRLIRQAGVSWLTLGLLLVQGGYVMAARPQPAALLAALRMQLGRVGVVAARFDPAIYVMRPRTGKLRGAALGLLLLGPAQKPTAS
jgi:hypothetical protein